MNTERIQVRAKEVEGAVKKLTGTILGKKGLEARRKAQESLGRVPADSANSKDLLKSAG